MSGPSRGVAAPPRLLVAGPWTAVLEEPHRAALEAALPAFLAGRRWFGGKARAIGAVEVADHAPVSADEAGPRLALLRVRYAEGEPERYALPLRFAPERAGAAAGPPGGQILRLAGGAEGLLCEADRDPAFARPLLDAIARGSRLAGRAGALVASSTRFHARQAEGTEGLLPAPLGAEQTNTSLRVGDRMILKLLRRLEAGPSPDLEVGRFLCEVAAFPHAAPVLGAVEYRPREGEPCAVAILHALVPGEGDAWGHVVGLARSLLARAGAEEPPAPEGPADLVALALSGASPPARLAALAPAALEAAALLGLRTAELHLALAGHPEEPAFRPEPFTGADARALHDEARGVVDSGLALLARRRAALAAPAGALAAEVLARAGGLDARLRWVLGRRLAGPRIRTHGDYHLGQVLWTGRDYVVIDFEGEPARPLAARRAKGSALRDVAGMIRSFHYASRAARGALASGAGAEEGAAGARRAEGWARAWYRAAAAAYLRAYLEAARAGGAVAADAGELRGLLGLHLAEKALYELAYELNHRPGWVELPLRGILDLLDAPAPGAEAP